MVISIYESPIQGRPCNCPLGWTCLEASIRWIRDSAHWPSAVGHALVADSILPNPIILSSTPILPTTVLWAIWRSYFALDGTVKSLAFILNAKAGQCAATLINVAWRKRTLVNKVLKVVTNSYFTKTASERRSAEHQSRKQHHSLSKRHACLLAPNLVHDKCRSGPS